MMHVTRTRQGGRPGYPNTVLFIGESRQLVEVCDWAQHLGLLPVDSPQAGLLCAVADPDVLDGWCTSYEAALLRRVRALGLPCLTPVRATAFLASAVNRRPTTAD